MKKFRKLQSLMFENDFTQTDIAKETGKSRSYISARFAGRHEWGLEDIYVICDLLDIPHTEISVYFPRGGMTVKP